MLVQARHDLGVKKAVGYTHRELSRQTRWTYLPPTAIGAVLGVVAGTLATPALLGAMLRGIGIMKVTVVRDLATPTLTAAAVVALAWLATWVMALRIRRVSAYALVTE